MRLFAVGFGEANEAPPPRSRPISACNCRVTPCTSAHLIWPPLHLPASPVQATLQQMASSPATEYSFYGDNIDAVGKQISPEHPKAITS